jgi:hypothetical protein
MGRRKGIEYGNALRGYGSGCREIQEMGNRRRAGDAAEWTGFKVCVRAAMVMQMRRHARHGDRT